jgi:ribosomal protein S18 acetylase RimI-like enzyme
VPQSRVAVDSRVWLDIASPCRSMGRKNVAMTPVPVIRFATASDSPRLADLDARSWPVALQVSPPQQADEPFFTAWREPADVIVADLSGSIEGYVRLGRHMRIPSNEHVLHIEALVVSPTARGNGLGSRLIAAAMEEARDRGVVKLGLRALSNNPSAIRLYERHGFVEEGRLRAELRREDGTYADDVWMALWLAKPA